MSSKAVAYILLSVLQFHSVLCFTSSKRAWQLGDKAGAYEKESKVDAEHPKLTDPIMVGSGHPSLDYKAFSFDGTDDYVKVLMNNNDQFKKFSMFMLVYPTATSGTLVHYKYTSGGQGGIDEILISIVSSRVEFKTNYITTDWTFTHPTVISLDAWHSVVYKRDADNGEISLAVDGISSTHAAATIDTVEYLGTPGELWLGQNIDSGNFFTGKITCVVFYDDIFPDTTEAKSGAYSECNGITSSSTPSKITDVDTITTTTPTTTTTTTTTTSSTTTTATTTPTTATMTTTPTATSPSTASTTTPPSTTTTTTTSTTTTNNIPVVSQPVALWRLDNTTYGYSTSGVAPQYPPLSECARLSAGCPDIPSRQSLMLDGASSSYLDLNVTFGILQSAFQIVLFVQPGIPSSGTILHLQYTGTQPGIRDVKLTARSSSVTLSVCDASLCCDSLNQAGALTADVWHFVVIERSVSTFGLMIDDSYVTRVLTCVSGSTSITDTVNLRVGQALDSQDVLRGSITCMAVYDYIATGAERKLNHISFCQDLVPSQLIFDYDMCLQTPTIRHSYYSLEQANAEPDVGVSALMTSPTTSLRQCGSLCIATRYCLSFTLTGISSQRECTLYDYVTRDNGLRSKTNTQYYVMKQED